MRNSEGPVKHQVIYLKPIRMLYKLMVAIFTIALQTWPWKKYIPVPLNITGFQNGNACYVIVISVQVFSYPVTSQINIQQIRAEQYVSIFTIMSHVVLCTADAHKINEQHVQRVPKCLALIGMEKYTHKNKLCY